MYDQVRIELDIYKLNRANSNEYYLKNAYTLLYSNYEYQQNIHDTVLSLYEFVLYSMYTIKKFNSA